MGERGKGVGAEVLLKALTVDALLSFPTDYDGSYLTDHLSHNMFRSQLR